VSKYEDMMKRDLGGLGEPKDTIPSGDWVLRCQSARNTENEDFDEDDGQNDHVSVVQFSHVPVRPHANVDEDAVETGEWRGVPIFTRRNIKTDRDLFDVKQIIEGHGISTEGRSLDDAIALMRTRETVATAGLRTFKRRTGETGKANTLSNFRPA